MSDAKLAWIKFVDVDAGAHPEHPIVIPPPGSPPGIWGGGNQPFPTPPIVIPEPPGGGPPLVIWGGPFDPPRPAHPIVIPLPPIDAGAHPEHPIVLPDPEQPPLGIWGPLPGFPTPPIVIPPSDPTRPKMFTWETQWSPETGWVVVGTPTFNHPAPSKK